MNKIDRLTKLVSDADEAYEQSVIGVLDEIAPGLDMESRQKIAEKICWNRYGYSSIDEVILMHDGRAFDNPALTDILTERIQKTRKENKELEPDIDKRYWCETCGSHSHETNPNTGYCFNCNTDNWEPENYRDVI
ncbi:hypothetical protein DWW91_11435 [Parabacteroides sp. AF17-3]|uniref:hypothetical protein n=1 Tax=Parabacteroides sp. AF17-3 TaxID=2293113 RepID=UPI000EFFEC27|nr:hypothetical protein [Parabacteroides sp. AF17-3]RKU69599.1 hypothetical protein DWW91_11435 [Parabacteroides sp. AF17-3]